MPALLNSSTEKIEDTVQVVEVKTENKPVGLAAVLAKKKAEEAAKREKNSQESQSQG